MEDRIVGPFTAIQFGIMVIGGGIAFFTAASIGLPSPINNILGFLIAAFTFVMAVGRFNNQPMYRFIRFIISFVVKPRIRVWHKKGVDIQVVKPNPNHKQNDNIHMVKIVSKKDIANLAAVLDSRGSLGLPPRIKPVTISKAGPPSQTKPTQAK